jgi:hypothetical protein
VAPSTLAFNSTVEPTATIVCAVEATALRGGSTVVNFATALVTLFPTRDVVSVPRKWNTSTV